MVANPDRAIELAYDQIARDYVQRGYRVVRRGDAGLVPDFLSDHQPDLVAERRDDHVVVEVKRTRSLRGSNDLRQLAERIAAHPGWRLELVALGKDADELAEIGERDWLETAMRQPNSLVDEPAMRPYFVVYQCQLLEALLRALAVQFDMRPHGKSPSRIAQELAFGGVIDQGTLSGIEESLRWRNAFVHGVSPSLGADDVSSGLTALCQDLHRQVRREATLTQEV